MSGPEAPEDAAARAWVQGVTYGRLLEFEGFHVVQRADEVGAYLPWFDVLTAAGSVVRVSFETKLADPVEVPS